MLLAAMATSCDSNTAGSLVAAAGGFRLRPVFSTAAFRRKLLEAVMCGGGSGDRSGKKGRNSRTLPLDPAAELHGSERLSELLEAEAVDEETRRKIKIYEELQQVVKRLQAYESGRCCDDRRREAAADIRRLAKGDAGARETLAMLGAIPPLVGMLDASGNVELNVIALYALLNLGIGNDMNKAAIVKAGLVHKMLVLIESGSSPPAVSEAIAANFLGLSALDSNKTIIGSSGAISFLVRSFTSHASSSQERQDALRALFNLSISPPNITCLIESGIVPSVFAALGDMEVSDKVLALLSNLVSSPEGRRAVSRASDAFAALTDVLSWSDAPACQEKAAYVLMVMAHKAGGRERAAMVEAGVVSALLELTLLGSALSQKRASRMLEILTVEKGKQVSEGFGDGKMWTVSAAVRSGAVEEGEEEDNAAGMSEEKRAVKQLVQQSLQSNMRRIVRRANLPQDFAPSDHFKALTASSTSKSLPF